jgi:hypothetical protein
MSFEPRDNNLYFDDGTTLLGRLDSPSVAVKAVGSIANLQLVKIVGVDTGNQIIQVAPWTGTGNIAGLVKTLIHDTQTGFMVSSGVVGNIDTSMYSAGDELYAEEDGTLNTTGSKFVGQVVVSDAVDGVIMVNELRGFVSKNGNVNNVFNVAPAVLPRHAVNLDQLVGEVNKAIQSADIGRISEGDVDDEGIATFTRDDGSSFTIDFSSFFDNTNLTDSDVSSMGYIKTYTDTTYSNLSEFTNDVGYLTTHQDISGKVDNNRVLTDVPVNAKFTDTVYTKPTSEPISYIVGLQGELDVKAIQSDIDIAVSNIKGGVVVDGDTLAKLRGLISIVSNDVSGIQQLLQSDDLNLDTLQEVVAFIKQNRSDLDSISLDWSSIQNVPANLVEDSNYTHTDNNYTTEEKSKLNNIAVGATNVGTYDDFEVAYNDTRI